MAELGIVCPLMIVKGDGTLALAETVALRPIETVLSGPAASLVGARWLSGPEDFIMSDMGGTTTDLGVLVDGRPQVAEQGAEVGGWRTMVKAIDVKTIGLGGDSEIRSASTARSLSARSGWRRLRFWRRAFPEVIAMLEADLADTDGGSMHGKFRAQAVRCSLARAAELEFAARSRNSGAGRRTPGPLRKIAVSSAAQRALASLKRKGLVQTGGFTPSDAAHVLGLQDNWPGPAAEIAAKLMVRFRDMRLGDQRASKPSAATCGRRPCGVRPGSSSTPPLARASASTSWSMPCVRAGPVWVCRISLSPAVPVVAVGGPVKVYYGEVGRRLGCEVVFPPFFDVANAVGAATGVIAQVVTVTCRGRWRRPVPRAWPGGVEMLHIGAAALVAAEAMARTAALRRHAMGARSASSVSITSIICPTRWTTMACWKRWSGRKRSAARDGLSRPS